MRRSRKRQFQLMIFTKATSLNSSAPQIFGKFTSKPMNGEHPFRVHQIDVSKEINIIGVVGERKSSIALVAMDCARLESSSRQYGSSTIFDLLYESRSICARRTNDHTAIN